MTHIGGRSSGWFEVGPTTTQELLSEGDAGLARSLFTVAAMRLALVTLALLGIVGFYLLDPPDRVPSWEFSLIGVTYALSVLYLFLLRYPRLRRGLAYLQIALDAGLVAVLVGMTGGAESPFTFAFFFVVLASSVTLYRRGAFLGVTAAVIMYGGLYALHVSELISSLPPLGPDGGSVALSFVGFTVGMLALGLLVGPLAEKLKTTGIKLAEKESDLAQLNQLHSAILRSLPAGVLVVNEAGVIGFGNDAAFQILRLGREDVVGLELQAIVPNMHPAWSHLRDSAFREDWPNRFEDDYVRSDGEVLRIGYSVAPLELGEALSALIVFQDVTDILRLKDAVERSRRLASVGQFAAGLAHEVRNPLASMCASIDVLRTSLNPPDNLARLMDNVTQEAERLNGLISDFLVLARPRALNLERRDLSGVVSEVLGLFQHDERLQKVDLVTDLQSGVEFEVDSDLMKQVVWNLVRNAVEALHPAGGRLQVEVFGADQGGCIQVEDDGPGIEPEVLAKIFDPFFTTKPGGSGLGLAITNSIVEAHDATMLVESTVGVGTRVQIRFHRRSVVPQVSMPSEPEAAAV